MKQKFFVALSVLLLCLSVCRLVEDIQEGVGEGPIR